MQAADSTESRDRSGAGGACFPLELAVVVPTFNERENIAPVLDRLAIALEGIRYEVILSMTIRRMERRMPCARSPAPIRAFACCSACSGAGWHPPAWKE